MEEDVEPLTTERMLKYACISSPSITVANRIFFPFFLVRFFYQQSSAEIGLQLGSSTQVVFEVDT